MRIVDFFEGKNVFLTGGSGFLGKVLIEKLLRSCPKIGNIYMLLREKKGKSLDSRLEIIKGLPLFDKLKEENPEALKKLIAVKGDVCDLNLGLSDADRKMLIEKVNIIYHTAASVRFDDFLKAALIINVRGTREICKLALELTNISLFVHVSTTYCNTDKKIIEEKIYPAHTDWRDAIKLAEECDEKTLNTMTEKYLSPLPNTYTFAKSLAEHVVDDLCKGTIPAIIVRPSVVISTRDDPIAGWNDNFNGPVGLLVAGGKGVLRTVLGNRDATPDYMPVDYVIKGLILATNHYGIKRNINKIEVLNAAQHDIHTVTMGEVVDMGAELIKDCPFNQILWNPRFSMTKCWYNYYIQVLLFHMLPAFILDTVLRLAGRKPMLFTIQRKIYIANNVLFYFMNNSWEFMNDKYIALLDTLQDDDEKTMFTVKIKDWTNEDIFEYFKNGKMGAAKYVLKEEFNREKGMRHLTRLWYLDMAVRTIFFSFLFWYLIIKIDVFHVLLRFVQNYISNLN